MPKTETDESRQMLISTLLLCPTPIMPRRLP